MSADQTSPMAAPINSETNEIYTNELWSEDGAMAMLEAELLRSDAAPADAGVDLFDEDNSLMELLTRAEKQLKEQNLWQYPLHQTVRRQQQVSSPDHPPPSSPHCQQLVVYTSPPPATRAAAIPPATTTRIPPAFTVTSHQQVRIPPAPTTRIPPPSPSHHTNKDVPPPPPPPPPLILIDVHAQS
ncbi:extensin-like [Nilaparvata lugens]|uniref:extensin-like n=1 Tax=Nilaparvata lugens TaxID=108931 RepID=UPI00193D930A|nr:extensin-like [Nilaparvata lugens]